MWSIWFYSIVWQSFIAYFHSLFFSCWSAFNFYLFLQNDGEGSIVKHIETFLIFQVMTRNWNYSHISQILFRSNLTFLLVSHTFPPTWESNSSDILNENYKFFLLPRPPLILLKVYRLVSILRERNIDRYWHHHHYNQYDNLFLLNVMSSAVRICQFVLWGGWRVDGGKWVLTASMCRFYFGIMHCRF